LRAPPTCAQVITFLVFIKAGDNFEFQVPCANKNGAAPYQIQSGGEVLVEDGIAMTRANKMSTKFSAGSIGEHILSVKQMINKASQLFWDSRESNPYVTFPHNKFGLSPYFSSYATPGTGTFINSIQYPQIFGDAFSWFAPMYLFQRGSIRFMASRDASVTDPNSHLYMTNTPLAKTTIGGNVFVNSGADNGRASAFENNAGEANGGLSEIWSNEFATPNDLNIGLHPVEVPYYSKYPVTFNHPATNSTYVTNFPDMPASILTVSASFPLDDTFILYRSCSDDFTFSFFLGCPPVLLGVGP